MSNENLSPAEYLKAKRELVEWLLCNDASNTIHSAEYPLSVLRERVAHIKAQREAESVASATGSVSATVRHERRNEDGSLTVEHEATFNRIADDLDGAKLPELDAETIEAERIEQERHDRAERSKQLASGLREHSIRSHITEFDVETLLRVSATGYSLPDVDRSKPRLEQWLPARLSARESDAIFPLIAWIDRAGYVQMGVVRQRFEHGDQPSFDASPFPGAWERVLLSQIVSVCHPATI